MNESKLPKIVVSVVTNRGYRYLANIINNFKRQKYTFKKLIIIFNCNIDKDRVLKKIQESNIQGCIFEIHPDKTLGTCLNRSIILIPESYNIWTKMDDDDYYGENYLLLNLKSMLYSKADIVGRRDSYVYVPELKRCYFRPNGGNKKYVDWVCGSTLFVKTNVFKKVMFPDKNRGEDTNFNKIAKFYNFRIYAGPIKDFIIVRHLHNHQHTWKLNFKNFFRFCRPVSNRIFKDLKHHVF